MRNEILRLEHLEKTTQEGVLLSDMSLSVYRGTLHCVLIQNPLSLGCLLNILRGYEKKDAGRMYVFEKPVETFTPIQSKRAGIYCIGERSSLIPGMSISENFFLTDKRYYRFGYINKKLMNSMAAELLREVGLHGITPDTPAGVISLSDAHMIEIIGAIAMGARILLLDSITEKYTERDMARLIRLLLSQIETGLSVVFFSRKYNAVFDVADYTTVIHNGNTIITLSKDMTSRNDVLKYLNVNTSELTQPNRPLPLGEVLSLRNISSKNGLTGVNFTLKHGEVLGIWDEDWKYSPSLSGVMFGSIPYSGEISIGKRPVSISSLSQAVKLGIVPIDENHHMNRVFQNMSLADNITLLMGNPLYSILGLRNASVRDFMCRHTLKTLNCSDLLDRYGHGDMLPPLTRYDQMKVVLAKWLCLRPKVLVIENPFLSFDDLTVHELFSLIDCICRENIGVLVFSMSLPELRQISDRVMTFRDGRLDSIRS